MRLDALIIGGGHNGLVCACYLAKAGKRVRVLERRGIVGGAAVTEEFYPGFRNSTASYTVSLLHPKVINDLRLVKHGLRIVERPFSNFLPLSAAAGDSLKVGGGLAATQAEVARFSKRDADRLPLYYDMLDRVADVLRGALLETPPNVGGGLGDVLAAIKLGRRFKALPMAARRDVLDLFTMSAGDLLDRWFESTAVKACFGFDSIVGHFASPYTPGSAYVLLHHVFGAVNGKKGIWGHAIGGMGAITQAMAKEAAHLGVEITTDSEVSEVLLDASRAQPKALGVRLTDGTVVEARMVAANVGPRVLGRLLPDDALGEEYEAYRDTSRHFAAGSATLRMNVALAELPDFSCLPNQGAIALPHHSSGIIMAPSMAYMEAAFFDAKQVGWSREPIVEMLIPSTVDDSLAPKGQHVASLFCQHFSYDLPPDQSWDDSREAVADLVLDTVTRYAPNFKKSVLARQIHTPLDLERKLGLARGDIFHGKLSLNQLFSARPMLGYGNYRTAVKGLYLCGSGAHPGGGVTGIPGHNAAHEILRG
jgi:phytoene dehydrogenase-like protein